MFCSCHLVVTPRAFFFFFSASRGSCNSWILYDNVTRRGVSHTARTAHTRHKVEPMGGPRLQGGNTLVAQRVSWSPSRWSVYLLAPLIGSRDLVRVILHTMLLIFNLKRDERWTNLLWAEDKESLSGIYNPPAHAHWFNFYKMSAWHKSLKKYDSDMLFSILTRYWAQLLWI